jgi:hypothetical protein
MILVGLFVLQVRRSKRDFVGVCRLSELPMVDAVLLQARTSPECDASQDAVCGSVGRKRQGVIRAGCSLRLLH